MIESKTDNNKHYNKHNTNKLKKEYKYNVEYDENKVYFYDTFGWRKYKTYSQLKQYAQGLIRKKPKDEWGDEKQTLIWKQGKSWKKNSKRKRQYTIDN